MKPISQFAIKILWFSLIFFFGRSLLIDASSSSSLRENSLITNMPGVSSSFVGRQESLEELHTRLKNQGASSTIAIIGMAGIGKTQLARKYAHTYFQNYDVLWWVDANQELLPQARELGLKLKTAKACSMPALDERTLEKWIGAIKNCNEKQSLRVLFLFDDVRDNDYIKPISTILTNAHMLLTSRNQSLGDTSIGNKKMQLKCFTRKESIDYLEHILPERPSHFFNKLAEALHDYPLALAQASSYIKEFPSLSIEDYLNLYRDTKKTLWKEEEKLAAEKSKNVPSLNDYHQTVSATFTLLLDHVIKTSPHAYNLLKFSSFLGSQDIPKHLLKSWMIGQKKLNDFDFHDAASTLIKYSIFEKNENDKDKGEKYNIHALLHEFIRDNLTKEEKELYLNEVTTLIASFLPNSSYQLWKALADDRYLEFHLESLLKWAERYHFQSDDLLTLKIKHLHNLYFSKSEFDESAKKIEPIEKEINSNDKLSSLEKARFLTIAGNKAAVKYGCNEAISICEKAEQLLNNISFPQAREELFFLLVNNLMEFYTNKGDLKKAEEAGKKAELLLPHINYPTYLILYYFMRSFQLLNKGDYKEALTHIDLAIEKFPSTDFPDHFHLFNKIVKAEILSRMGELNQALDLATESYNEFKKYYPNDSNFKLFRTEMILAYIYLKQGNLSESKRLINSAIKGLNIVFDKPDENPTQGFSHIILGEIHEKQNDFLKALNAYVKAEEIYNHIFKTVELDDVSYLYKNLAILGEKVKDDFITKKYFHLLLKHFGRSHPRTQEVVDYLVEKGLQVPWSHL